MADHPSPDLNAGDRLRFLPASEGFQLRNRLADALLSHWTLVAGSGSWLKANLLGCGIDAAEVWELVAQVPPEQPLLVLLSDSIAADQGRTLIARLRRQRPGLQVLLLVQHERWLSAEALEGMQAQAIVHVESFGSGTTIRALQALRRGQRFLDPRLAERLQQQAFVRLTGREQQTLEALARGDGNRATAAALDSAPPRCATP